MGWYRTCSICGMEGKYGLACNCHEKVSNEILKSVSGYQLLEQKIIYDMFNPYIYQKFLDLDENSIYLSICLNMNNGEYSPTQRVTKISSEEYYTSHEDYNSSNEV